MQRKRRQAREREAEEKQHPTWRRETHSRDQGRDGEVENGSTGEQETEYRRHAEEARESPLAPLRKAHERHHEGGNTRVDA
jgi:hypothetical protein